MHAQLPIASALAEKLLFPQLRKSSNILKKKINNNNVICTALIRLLYKHFILLYTIAYRSEKTSWFNAGLSNFVGRGRGGKEGSYRSLGCMLHRPHTAKVAIWGSPLPCKQPAPPDPSLPPPLCSMMPGSTLSHVCSPASFLLGPPPTGPPCPRSRVGSGDPKRGGEPRASSHHRSNGRRTGQAGAHKLHINPPGP